MITIHVSSKPNFLTSNETKLQLASQVDQEFSCDLRGKLALALAKVARARADEINGAFWQSCELPEGFVAIGWNVSRLHKGYLKCRHLIALEIPETVVTICKRDSLQWLPRKFTTILSRDIQKLNY